MVIRELFARIGLKINRETFDALEGRLASARGLTASLAERLGEINAEPMQDLSERTSGFSSMLDKAADAFSSVREVGEYALKDINDRSQLTKKSLSEILQTLSKYEDPLIRAINRVQEFRNSVRGLEKQEEGWGRDRRRTKRESQSFVQSMIKGVTIGAGVIKGLIAAAVVMYGAQWAQNNKYLRTFMNSFMNANPVIARVGKTVEFVNNRARNLAAQGIARVRRETKNLNKLYATGINLVKSFFAVQIAKKLLTIVMRVTTATAELALNLDKLNERAAAFLTPKQLEESEHIFNRLQKTAKGYFSELDFKRARDSFLQANGTFNEFSSIIEGAAKRAVILDKDLGETATTFLQAIKNGDLAPLVNSGMLARGIADQAAKAFEGLDDVSRRMLATQIVMSESLKLNSRETSAYEKILNGLNAGIRRSISQFTDLKNKIGSAFVPLIYGADILADILEKINRNQFMIRLLRGAFIFGAVASLGVSILALAKGLIYLNSVLRITSFIFSLLSLKIIVITGALTLLILIFEDMAVALRGGDSLIGDLFRTLDDNAPIAGQMLHDLTDWFFALVRAIGEGGAAWKDFFTIIGESKTADELSLAWRGFIETLKDWFLEVGESIWDSITSWFERTMEYLEGLLGRFLDKTRDKIKNAIREIPGGETLLNIGAMISEGVGLMAPTPAAAAAGSVSNISSQMNRTNMSPSMSVNMTINQAPGQSPEDLSKAVDAVLRKGFDDFTQRLASELPRRNP